MVAIQAQEKAEREAWLETPRKLQHRCVKWARRRRQFSEMADAYRHEHQDANGGDESWLIVFASVRVPRVQMGRQGREKCKKKGVGS